MHVFIDVLARYEIQIVINIIIFLSIVVTSRTWSCETRYGHLELDKKFNFFTAVRV
jgi:hypothetical protein